MKKLILILICLARVCAVAQPSLDGAIAGTFGIPNVVAAVANLTNNIVAYYPFDVDYNDHSGAGNNLTPTSSPSLQSYYVLNQNGGIIWSALYDGTGGYGLIADNASIAMGSDASFSVSVWVYLNTAGSTRCIAIKGDYESAVNGYTWFLDDNSTVFRFGLGDGASHGGTVSSTTGQHVVGAWCHLVGVYNATNHLINLWVNAQTNTPVAWTNTYHSTFGMGVGRAASRSEHADAQIDEFVMWTNRALMPSEVAQIYTNGLLAKTMPNWGSPGNFRNTVVFNGDARFAVVGSTNSIPNYWTTNAGLANPWASNHNATVVNYSGGIPPANFTLESIGDLTNAVPGQSNLVTNNTAHLLAWAGPGTNLYYVSQVGINNIITMTGAPLMYGISGPWTSVNNAYATTNYWDYLTGLGVRVVGTTIIPEIGLETAPGDGTWSQQEQVWTDVNTRLTNAFPRIFAGMDCVPFLPTNNTPAYWSSGQPSEMNDTGATNFAVHLNAVFNAAAPSYP